jgi:hypothetical protein
MYFGFTDSLKSPKAKKLLVMNYSWKSYSGSVRKYFLLRFWNTALRKLSFLIKGDTNEPDFK